MLDIKFIVANTELVKENCKKRGFDVDIDEIVQLEQRRKSILHELAPVREESNKLAKKWAEADESYKERANHLKSLESELSHRLRECEQLLDEKLAWVPNMIDPRVPIGDEEATVTLREVGTIRKFDFRPHPHEEIGEILDIIDIPRGVKTAKTRFCILKNEAVKLRYALMKMFMDHVEPKGFTLISPPYLAKEQTLFASGYLPFALKDNFALVDDNLSLIGTSEQSIIGMHMGDILTKLPLLYLGDSLCFRTEAGSYGRDTSGILRTHQFYKLEQIVFCHPNDSEEWHQKCLENEEWITTELGIPYRVVLLPSSDLAAPGRIKYDIEAWFPSQGRYRELTSNTNLTDYQTRRGKIRYKIGKEKGFPHIISATGFSDRLILAILENYQRENGSVQIPEKLVPYMYGQTEIPPRNKK